MLRLWLLTVALMLGSPAPAFGEDPVVEMGLGKVRGYTSTSRAGKQFFAFTGIPYAKPPVGKLRFQPPEPVSSWEGVKDATKNSPMCIQYRPTYNQPPISVGEEDCLYLSVFTRNISGNAPVLFHIHGGAFTAGYGLDHQPEFLMDEDIVIVVVEYRLGIFGFLTFEAPDTPSNQGMKDQVLALKWVQENIRSFGGNSDLVTIIGESAGGASVYHHTISPLSRGLFHRAIAESGGSYASWAVAPQGFRRACAEKLMNALGCPTNPPDAMSCIMKKDSDEIFYKAGKITLGPGSQSALQFGPSFEEAGPDAFLVGPPSEWEHSPVPFLMGTTSGEGLMFTLRYLARDFDFKSFSANYNQMAPFILGYFNSASNPEDVTKEIRRFYLPKEEITLDDFANLTMACSDSTFTVSIMDGANNHKGDVYFYYFDYKTSFPGIDDKYNIGAMHCAESQFIWNVPDYAPLVAPNEVELSKALVKVVVNFMRTGVPTSEGSPINWEKWTPESHNYIKVDSEGFHAMKGLAEDRYKLWKSIRYNDLWEKSN